MADHRKKTSMAQVLADIKPYITKKFMTAPCIKEQDIQAICQILLPRYKNVQLMQGLTNNKPDFRIRVKGLFGTEEKRFEVVGGDKSRSAAKKKSDFTDRTVLYAGLAWSTEDCAGNLERGRAEEREAA